MRITHEWKERDEERSTGEDLVYKAMKKTWNNVFDVTFYQYLPWRKIYWCTSTTGVRAHCFNADYYTVGAPQVVAFENEHEMRRFQENLRLQEENARTPIAPQTLAVR